MIRVDVAYALIYKEDKKRGIESTRAMYCYRRSSDSFSDKNCWKKEWKERGVPLGLMLKNG